MNKNLFKFGQTLEKLKIRRGFSLREVCQLVDYDPSNWSKIERGKIPPPADESTLNKWAKAMGLSQDVRKVREFIDQARIAQGIIPQDILAQKNAMGYLPAFFRTLRNEKPTREEIDRLIELIKSA